MKLLLTKARGWVGEWGWVPGWVGGAGEVLPPAPDHISQPGPPQPIDVRTQWPDTNADLHQGGVGLGGVGWGGVG